MTVTHQTHTRYPSVTPQVALIMMLETLLGPFWVFLRFGDVPSSWTLAGGAVLLTALFAHEVAAIREVRRVTAL